MTEGKGGRPSPGEREVRGKALIKAMDRAATAVTQELGLPQEQKYSVLPLLSGDREELQQRKDLPFDQKTRGQVFQMREAAEALVGELGLPEQDALIDTYHMIGVMYGEQERKGKGNEPEQSK